MVDMDYWMGKPFSEYTVEEQEVIYRKVDGTVSNNWIYTNSIDEQIEMPTVTYTAGPIEYYEDDNNEYSVWPGLGVSAEEAAKALEAFRTSMMKIDWGQNDFDQEPEPEPAEEKKFVPIVPNTNKRKIRL